jgi:hypothetical protein
MMLRRSAKPRSVRPPLHSTRTTMWCSTTSMCRHTLVQCSSSRRPSQGSVDRSWTCHPSLPKFGTKWQRRASAVAPSPTPTAASVPPIAGVPPVAGEKLWSHTPYLHVCTPCHYAPSRPRCTSTRTATPLPVRPLLLPNLHHL